MPNVHLGGSTTKRNAIGLVRSLTVGMMLRYALQYLLFLVII